MVQLAFWNRKKKKESSPPDVVVLALATFATTPTASSSSNGDTADNPYGKVGLGSTPKGPNSVPITEAEKMIKKDGHHRLLGKGGDTARMLFFLYGRGFMAEAKKKDRIKKVLEMTKGEVSKKRLLQVVEADGDTDLSGDDMFIELYAVTKCTLERYFAQPNTHGFLPEMQEAKLYLRSQKSGNCYLQAPCIMLAYLSQKHGIDNPPVDISNFVRRRFSDDELYDYIKIDAGGHSVSILKNMVQNIGEDPDDVVTYSYGHFRKGEHNVDAYLKMYGPGLVSGFLVHKNFERPGKSSEIGCYRFSGDHGSKGTFHSLCGDPGEDDALLSKTLGSLKVDGSSKKHRRDKPVAQRLVLETDKGGASLIDTGTLKDGAKKPQNEECHAMVLIGVRKEGTKVWLLLQNWWTNMQLVEVSWDYFANAEGKLTFFAKRSVLNETAYCFDRMYSLNSSPKAECDHLDKKEDPADVPVLSDPWSGVAVRTRKYVDGHSSVGLRVGLTRPRFV